MLEIEAKIKLKDREELLSRGRLIQGSKDHVFDIYFDKNDEFKSSDKVLRLRKHNDKVYLAYKGPRIKDGNLLVREEYEPEVSDFETSEKIIEHLGFSPVQMTEKTREKFTLEEYHHVKIELDHYPFIGYYFEVEGERDDVLAVIETLGFSMDDAVAKNCTELFFEYLKKNNLKLENPALQFTFEGERQAGL